MDQANEKQTSWYVLFLDSFLQERNIKWMLAVGMLILLASSLLLVSTHWTKYPPLWQNLIVLSYAVAVHGAGQWTYHRMGLRKTGTVLQGLTVMLIPILFLVIHWIPEQTSHIGSDIATRMALFAATTAFGFLAARRVLGFFLRSTQPTFLASYVILAMAGAVLPMAPAAASPWLLAGLWLVFTIGSIKVSRHVFWLTEEHRAPRIFGFFPILLLGAQFLFLYVAHPPLHTTLPMIGLGCVLTAIPVLATADAVARVFQQRTGDLVRPLPWAIVLPLLVGLGLTGVGCILSGTGLLTPPHHPHELVPTAALAAGLLALVARRTGKPAFVWAMLIAITLAYNFSPVFFLEIVNAIKNQGAALVQEQRLPFAFYGITYFPLLAVLLFAERRLTRAGSELFARPIRQFLFGLTALLWALSLTHVKAVFPVGVGLVAMSALQVRLTRYWPAIFTGVLAWISAALGLPMFADTVLHVSLLAHTEIATLAVAAAGLLFAGKFLDRKLAAMMPEWLADLRPLHGGSLLVSIALTAVWFVPGVVADPTLMAVALGSLLVVHAFCWLRPTVSVWMMLFVEAAVLRYLLAHAALGLVSMLNVVSVLLAAQWLIGMLIERFGPASATDAVGKVISRIANGWLIGLLIVVHLPTFVFAILGNVAPIEPIWVSPLMCLAATLDWLRCSRSPLPTVVAYAGVVVFVGSTELQLFGPAAIAWLPVIVALLALVADRIAVAGRANLDETWTTSLNTSRILSEIVFLATGVGSLLAFTVPARMAGGLAIVGLWGSLRTTSFRHRPLGLYALANLQVFAAIVTFIAPGIDGSALLFPYGAIVPLVLPLVLTAALSSFAWQFVRVGDDQSEQTFAVAIRSIFTGAAAVGLAISLTWGKLVGFDVVVSLLTFAALIADQVRSANRERQELRVWAAEAIAALAVGYFVSLHVVTLHHGFGMFVLLGIAVALEAVTCVFSEQSNVFLRPFRRTALVMPIAAVALGVFRHFASVPSVWLGANSLALLFAAGFYFWKGIEGGGKRFHVLAAVILNVALALLWNELTWTDPQLFMVPIGISALILVQLLKDEIAESLHNPLRYAGALVILVSPTFHILGQSWIPIFTLMVASVAVILVGIGLRVRALLYAGAGFLLADLVAMVVRGGITNPSILWIAGLGLGAGIITLGAYCEKHREQLLARMHLLASTLKTWE